MLGYAMLFLVLAALACLLGLFGAAATAKWVFLAFLVLLAVGLVVRAFRGQSAV